MKTITLKSLIKFLTVVFVFSIFSTSILAQEEEEKTVKIKKVMKSDDGTETVMDTSFTVKDLEELENMDVWIGDEKMKDIDIKLKELDELDEIDVDVFITDEDGEEEKHVIMVKRKGDAGDMEEMMTEYKYMINEGDSMRTIEVEVSADGESIFISEDGEIKTIETDGGEQKIIIKKCKDGEDISLIYSDDVEWEGEQMINIEVEDSDDGKKVIIKEEDGEVKEYIIEGDEGAYMINEDGDIIKVEGDGEVIWTDDGDNTWVSVTEEDGGNQKIIIKKTDGTTDVQTVDGKEYEEDVFVNVMKTKDGDKTTIITTKCIIKSLNEEDKKSLEKAGVDLAPESNENKLEMDKLSFHPNPSNGKFTLKFNTEQKGDTDIRIYDINGKEVYNERVRNFDGKYEKEIDISENGSGTYFLKVSQGEKMMTRKIILE